MRGSNFTAAFLPTHLLRAKRWPQLIPDLWRTKMIRPTRVAELRRPLFNLFAFLTLCIFSSFVPALAQNGSLVGPTRLLRTPTVSATDIAFAYANNIWIVPRAGGNARRLTSFQGQTMNPHFSPDGHFIAFSGEYAGTTTYMSFRPRAVSRNG